MRKLFLPITIASAISISSYAKDYSRDGAFIQAFGGKIFSGNQISSDSGNYRTFHHMKPSAIYGLAYGYNFHNFAFSALLDRTTMPFESSTDSVNITTFLANAAYNFNTGTRFTPYLGAGAGFAHRTWIADSGKNFAYDGAEYILALQLSAGAKYAICDKVDIFTDIRYKTTGEAKQNITNAGNTIISATAAAFRFFAVTAGISYKF